MKHQVFNIERHRLPRTATNSDLFATPTLVMDDHFPGMSHTTEFMSIRLG